MLIVIIPDMSSPFKSMKLAQPNIVSCMSPAKTKLVLTSPKPQLTFSQPGTPARNSYSCLYLLSYFFSCYSMSYIVVW